MQQRPSRTTRALCRIRVHLYKLIVIAALNLLPLLTWHNATMHFFEEYHIDGRLKDTLKQRQLGAGKTLLWVAVWILIWVPIDIANALRNLGQCQQLLHPRKRTFELDEDPKSLEPAKHDETTKDNAKRFPYLDHLLQVLLSKPGRLILSLFYDMTMLLVLGSHVYVFFSLCGPSKAICDAVNPHFFSHQNGTHVSDKLSDREKCTRYDWNLFTAGYFSSGMAGLLAAFHFAALLFTIGEIAYSWMYGDVEEGEEKSDGHSATRYIDIRTREGGTSRTTGRLTDISEEEHRAGSGSSVRRRMNKSKSSEGQESKASSSGSSRLEEVLLECLVE